METAVGVKVYKKREQPFRMSFVHLYKGCRERFLNYIHFLFLPSKKVTPEAKGYLKEMVEEVEDPKNLSPRFTNTKDAVDWLNS